MVHKIAIEYTKNQEEIFDLLTRIGVDKDLGLDHEILKPKNLAHNLIYGIIREGSATVGIVIVEPWNQHLAEGHIGILEGYRSLGLGKAAIKILLKDIAKKTAIKTFFMCAPALNSAAIALVESLGGEYVGRVRNGVEYKGRLCSLNLYEKDIVR